MRHTYRKRHLPNYQVFDEIRYFTLRTETCILPRRGVPVAVTICEDIWREGPVEDAARAGAQLILNLNASPFSKGKWARRRALLEERARDNAVAIVYVNLVGGQDELVFDGGSMVYDHSGEPAVLGPCFEEALIPVTFNCAHHCQPVSQPRSGAVSEEAGVYQALVLGVQDYVNKNGFKSVVLGLSGGIDSALTLAVAVDALGPDRVHAVMMPFRYTSSMSLEDAEAEARHLGVRYDIFSIEPMYDAFMETPGQTVRRPGAGYHRGELAGASAGRAADESVQQVSGAGADHRQQERDGGGLLDALRRHGGWF